ncbi:hypothetical protein DTO012A8_9593 [Penicillium roqueforti]|nr:hypothetical protein DTO012A8_9593 [Penicillium roqueforti]
MQFAMKCHYLLATTSIGALFYHLVERQSSDRWYLTGAVFLWLFISAAVCLMAIWDQKPWKPPRNEVTMNSVSNFLWLDITIPLNRAIHPGQYVQLWMPRTSFRAFFQLPIFHIAFWEDGPTQRTVRKVAEPRLGLTRKLYHDALQSPSKQPVTVLGPYGHPLSFHRFGTILFVVEDIGFFRALSYIDKLVEASRKREVMVRKLEVIWKRRVGSDGYPPWVDEWMQELLNRDWRAFKVGLLREPSDAECPGLTDFQVLQFSIYCPRTQSGPEEDLVCQKGERLWYFYGSIKIEEKVAQHISNRCGAVAVAVCASPVLREAVKKTVQPHAGKNLQLMIFDPDTCPARTRDEKLPDSDQPTVGDHRQPPPGTPGESEETHQLRQYPTDSKKLLHSLSRRVDTQTESVQMSNHSKWVENKLAQARRKPTITITEL